MAHLGTSSNGRWKSEPVEPHDAVYLINTMHQRELVHLLGLSVGRHRRSSRSVEDPESKLDLSTQTHTFEIDTKAVEFPDECKTPGPVSSCSTCIRLERRARIRCLC
jgi:hypothetical protein